MNIVFIEPYRNNLLPFTFTKPVSELRVGILTMREKWEKYFSGCNFYNKTEEYLNYYKWKLHLLEDNFFINASVIPNQEIVDKIVRLHTNQSLFFEDELIAYRSKEIDNFNKKIYVAEKPLILKNVWDIFSINAKAIERDYQSITNNRTSEAIPKSVTAFYPENIFIEKGAKLFNASLNASEGPIYIGKDAEIMESVNVRGSFALCQNSVLKMGAKIYPGTTIGPYSKVGGEVSNSVIQGYSNKGHDGFLGNSVLGQWCNIGADTNTSNLKNNYASVKLWDYTKSSFKNTGLQFCGLMMGDHSKCGINTMFNTGTVIGVNANIFGSGFPRNFVPSYSWGGSSGFITYKLSKAEEVANAVMYRRGLTLNKEDKDILSHVFNLTKKYRKSYSS